MTEQPFSLPLQRSNLAHSHSRFRLQAPTRIMCIRGRSVVFPWIIREHRYL